MDRSSDGGCCCFKTGLVSMVKSMCCLDPTQTNEVMVWDTFFCVGVRRGGYFLLFLFLNRINDGRGGGGRWHAR